MQIVSPIQRITGLTITDIEGYVRGKAIVLLAPRFRNRNALLAWFTTFGTELFFHTLAPSDTTLRGFLTSLVANICDVYPTFGKQTKQVLSSVTAPIEDWADALAADLAKAKPKPVFVVLDNFDYLQPSADATTFFLRLATQLHTGMHLVINSRELALEPWLLLVRGKQALFLGDELSLDGGIFDANKPNLPHLEIYGLLGGNIYVNGLPAVQWDGPLPKQLFYYFIDHPMVTRDEIFATFWPDVPKKEATNVFHVTKRKISEQLGFELTKYLSAFYIPSGQMQVHYDVRNFEALLQMRSFADDTFTDVPPEWYSAIHLYRTPFLPGLSTPWIEQRRLHLKQAYVGALVGIARIHKTQGDTASAITYYLRALRETPEREDIHRELMALYASNRDIDKVVEQFAILTTVLKRTLHISPSKATRQFFKGIVGSDPA